MKVFKQPASGTDPGRDISLDMSKAEAVTHLGGDDYLVTIAGNNHRIKAPGTTAAALHAHNGEKYKD